jgi:RNA polymerase sigma-70 factor (ECF subfamily)
MEFPQTCWTILAQATLHGDTAARSALESLCQRYWKPVHAHIRSRGLPPEKCEDLTQDFFLHVMQSGLLHRASPQMGKFRSYLLGSLRYFLAHDAERNAAQRRGGGLQQAELTDDIAAVEADDTAFDREWALSTLESALSETRHATMAARGEDGWNVLKRFLPGSGESPAYQTAAGLLGMSLAALKSEVFRLRQAFRDALRRTVGATVATPEELDQEMAHLRRILTA